MGQQCRIALPTHSPLMRKGNIYEWDLRSLVDPTIHAHCEGRERRERGTPNPLPDLSPGIPDQEQSADQTRTQPPSNLHSSLYSLTHPWLVIDSFFILSAFPSHLPILYPHYPTPFGQNQPPHAPLITATSMPHTTPPPAAILVSAAYRSKRQPSIHSQPPRQCRELLLGLL